MDISEIKYAGVYSGPGYGNPWDPSYEGFTSLDQARERYTERQHTSGRYRLDCANLTVEHGEITAVECDSTYWPGTSTEDTLEIYPVSDGRISGEPFTRFVAGPRGGIKRENYY